MMAAYLGLFHRLVQTALKKQTNIPETAVFISNN
jgi:hypothetical protein